MYMLKDMKRQDKDFYLRKDWEEDSSDAFTDDLDNAMTFKSFEEAFAYKSPREKIVKVNS